MAKAQTTSETPQGEVSQQDILQFVSHQLPGRDIQALSQAIRGCIPGGSGARTTSTPHRK